MKFAISHSKIRTKLEKLGATLLAEVRNEDIYFNHPQRDFASTDEALRVRVTGENIHLTYKGKKLDDRTKTREEIDIGVETTEISEILKRLGFYPDGEVIKQREEWQLDDFTITLDNVKELGEYLEIELMGNDEEKYDEVLNKMHQTLALLDIDPKDQIRESYLDLVRKK